MAGRGFGKDSSDEILSEINVIPLVDISLVLLIIFMATANFIMMPQSAQGSAAKAGQTNSKMSGINIPKGKYAKDGVSIKPTNIYITKDGVTYLEKEPLLVDELADELERLKISNPDAKILLQVDNASEFKYLAKVLDVISRVDLKNFSIAVEEEVSN